MSVGPGAFTLGLGRYRCCATAVAGVAGHVLFTVPEGSVDRAHHNDHSARGHLLRFGIGGPVIDVTEGARSLIQKAQRLNEGLHGGRYVGSLEYLDVLAVASTATLPLAAAAPPGAPPLPLRSSRAGTGRVPAFLTR